MVIFNLMMMMILDIMIVVMVSYFMMMMIIFNFMMLIGIWFHDDYDNIYSIFWWWSWLQKTFCQALRLGGIFNLPQIESEEPERGEKSLNSQIYLIFATLFRLLYWHIWFIQIFDIGNFIQMYVVNLKCSTFLVLYHGQPNSFLSVIFAQNLSKDLFFPLLSDNNSSGKWEDFSSFSKKMTRIFAQNSPSDLFFPPALSENNFWQSGSFCPPCFQEGKGLGGGRRGGLLEKREICQV